MRAAERRTSGPYLRKPWAICLYLTGRHDHTVQMDPRESAVEITPVIGVAPMTNHDEQPALPALVWAVIFTLLLVAAVVLFTLVLVRQIFLHGPLRTAQRAP